MDNHDDNHDEKIKALEAQIEKIKVEKKKWMDLTPQQRMAEILHSKLCHYSHEDQCGWFYEDWNKPFGNYSARAQYLKKATMMLNLAEADVVENIIKLL